MRFSLISLAILVALIASGCNFWPKELKTLAESISQQVSGHTTAWLMGGDVVVINISGSAHYQQAQPDLEALATELAEQVTQFLEEPLESIVISFYEKEASADTDEMREFIFLMLEGRPVLQWYPQPNASGALGQDEIEAAVKRMDESYDRLDQEFPADQRGCILTKALGLASGAGDPETLDLKSLDYIPEASWNDLDATSRRIMLAQTIVTEAMFVCVSRTETDANNH